MSWGKIAAPVAPAASATASRWALQKALGRLTVAELVECTDTLRMFHGFLATGTAEERQRLWSPLDIETPSSHPTTAASSPSSTTPSSTFSTRSAAGFSSPAALSAPSPADSASSLDPCPPRNRTQANVALRAKSFFQSRLGTSRQSRVQYLVRAVEGFLGAYDVTDDFASEIWRPRTDIFTPAGGTGPMARLRRLYAGHCRIKRSRDDYSCADRLCYIFLDHDLEQLAQSDELVMSQGRGRKTVALHKQARHISTTVEELRAHRKGGIGYRHLLHQGGPGLLLLIGSQISTIWERKLSKSDIDLIIVFLKAELPVIYATGKALDSVAAQSLVNGFLAYGWTLSELRSIQSPLMEQLKLYINIDKQPQEDYPQMERYAEGQPGRGHELSSVFFNEKKLSYRHHRAETPTDQQVLLENNTGSSTPLLADSQMMKRGSAIPLFGDVVNLQQNMHLDFAPAPHGAQHHGIFSELQSGLGADASTGPLSNADHPYRDDLDTVILTPMELESNSFDSAFSVGFQPLQGDGECMVAPAARATPMHCQNSDIFDFNGLDPDSYDNQLHDSLSYDSFMDISAKDPDAIRTSRQPEVDIDGQAHDLTVPGANVFWELDPHLSLTMGS